MTTSDVTVSCSAPALPKLHLQPDVSALRPGIDSFRPPARLNRAGRGLGESFAGFSSLQTAFLAPPLGSSFPPVGNGMSFCSKAKNVPLCCRKSGGEAAPGWEGAARAPAAP